MRPRKKYFEEGDEVAHKENLKLKLFVKQIVKYKKTVYDPIKKEKIEKNFISGIKCGWWKGKDYVYGVFHTRELVPWEISTQGKEKVIEWLEQN